MLSKKNTNLFLKKILDPSILAKYNCDDATSFEQLFGEFKKTFGDDFDRIFASEAPFFLICLRDGTTPTFWKKETFCSNICLGNIQKMKHLFNRFTLHNFKQFINSDKLILTKTPMSETEFVGKMYSEFRFDMITIQHYVNKNPLPQLKTKHKSKIDIDKSFFRDPEILNIKKQIEFYED